MRVTIRQKNLKITPALDAYIGMKILKPIRQLLRKLRGAEFPIVDLEIARTTRHHRKGKIYSAEANLSLGGKLLRAEAEGEDVRAAIDLLSEEIEREIKTYKGKNRAFLLRGARQAKKDLRLDPAARLYRRGRIREEGG